jgi:hypothetical protein
VSEFISEEQAKAAEEKFEREAKVKAKLGKEIDVTVTTSINVCLACLFCDHLAGHWIVVRKGFMGIRKKERYQHICSKLKINLNNEYIESDQSPCEFNFWECTTELEDALTVKHTDVLKGKVVDPKLLNRHEFIEKKYLGKTSQEEEAKP